jgi:excinuclease ABC subunit B
LEPEEDGPELPPEQLEKFLAEMEERMREAARKFDFKQAAAFRDRIKEIRNRSLTSSTSP